MSMQSAHLEIATVRSMQSAHLQIASQLIELMFKTKVLSIEFEDGSGKKFIITTSDNPLKKKFVNL